MRAASRILVLVAAIVLVVGVLAPGRAEAHAGHAARPAVDAPRSVLDPEVARREVSGRKISGREVSHRISAPAGATALDAAVEPGCGACCGACHAPAISEAAFVLPPAPRPDRARHRDRPDGAGPPPEARLRPPRIAA